MENRRMANARCGCSIPAQSEWIGIIEKCLPVGRHFLFFGDCGFVQILQFLAISIRGLAAAAVEEFGKIGIAVKAAVQRNVGDGRIGCLSSLLAIRIRYSMR